MKDYFDRELKVGDKCFRLSKGRFSFGITLIEVLDFTNTKVKVAEKTYISAHNLIRADADEIN